MPRLMSVAKTTAAVRNRTKTVTRRTGWQFLKPGDRLTLCPKVMGRGPGEPLERIAEVEVISVRREPLEDVTDEEARLEGFPEMTGAEFVRFYCDTFGVDPFVELTRIEWRYLP